MKTTDKANYILIENNKDPLTEFASELTRQHANFEHANIIVDLKEYEHLELEDLLGFLELSNTHREHKKSFVIVNNALNADKIPEDLIIAPTLQEAEDIIQMEEIERDLGF
ncbi:ribonuclease Z [Zunongwangia sp. F363]|uniref:Ribonuclease Z n=1 Tax=Autumnicola tepida TaxID=3075595 RepID=A0ABU3CDH3_9FLAO|nr:ribonuclease Z [Zunongwangia sp. F363]MDT0644389.1 ribonuclease Z [Zunongwangia sp. F363]